eukprot:560779-Prymnesium_polylepis.1
MSRRPGRKRPSHATRAPIGPAKTPPRKAEKLNIGPGIACVAQRHRLCTLRAVRRGGMGCAAWQLDIGGNHRGLGVGCVRPGFG